MYFARNHRIRVLRKQHVTYLEPNRKVEFFCARPLDIRLNADFPTLKIRGPSNCFDTEARHRFQPDGLPDTCRARIPDGMRLSLPVLLSAGLRKVEWVVKGPNNDLLRTGF